MPSSLLKRRMFSFGGTKTVERKESVVRSSAWPCSDLVESETMDSLGDCLEDKGSAVKKVSKRDMVGQALVKDALHAVGHGHGDDDVLIKAMREDGDECESTWLTEGAVDEDVMREISPETVNVLPSLGALEETLFTDTNTESLVRLVRQLHEQDDEIDPAMLDDEKYYDVPRAVDTHSLLKAATASKLADFEEKLEDIAKLMDNMMSKRMPENSVKENVAVLEQRVRSLETAVTVSMTDQDKRLSALGHVVEALRDELEMMAKSYRILDQKNRDVVDQLNALQVVEHVVEERNTCHRHHVKGKGVLVFLLTNIGVPLLTILLAHRHFSKKA